MVNANIRDPRSRLITRVRNDLLSVEDIPIQLQRLHEGIAYSATLRSPTVGAGAFVEILIRTDPSIEMHAEFGVATGGPVLVELFEAPTVTSPGGLGNLVIANRNRRVGGQPVSVLTSTPTIAGTTTVLVRANIPGTSTPGEGGVTGGDINRSFDEWILDPGQDYLFRITNDDIVPQEMSPFLVFYEAENVGIAPAVRAHQ